MRLLMAVVCLMMIEKVQAADKAQSETKRRPAQAGEMVDIRNVVSSQSGYWDANKKGAKFYGRFASYLVAQPNEDHHNLRIYVEADGFELPKTDAKNVGRQEKPQWLNDDSKFAKLVDNSKFVWGSDWGGTQPALSVNGKGSLKIMSQNEGIGRNAWTQTVTANITPSAQGPSVDMIGFDYDDRDRLDLSWSTCSLNFNTGKGVKTSQAGEVDENGKKLKKQPKKVVTNFTVSRKLVSVNDLTDEMIQALPCFK